MHIIKVFFIHLLGGYTIEEIALRQADERAIGIKLGQQILAERLVKWLDKNWGRNIKEWQVDMVKQINEIYCLAYNLKKKE